jgi:hypothetical protein
VGRIQILPQQVTLFILKEEAQEFVQPAQEKDNYCGLEIRDGQLTCAG